MNTEAAEARKMNVLSFTQTIPVFYRAAKKENSQWGEKKIWQPLLSYSWPELFCPRVLPKVTTQWHCPHLCSENNTLLVNIENILKSQRLNIGKTEYN